MRISFSVIEDVVARYGPKTKASGEPVRSLQQARELTVEALVERLRKIGIEMNCERLEPLTLKSPSAEVVARGYYEEFGDRLSDDDEEWIWMVLVCLWERWFPDRMNLEMIDGAMQNGYDVEGPERCLHWMAAWHGILRLMERFDIPTISEFDRRILLSQSMYNWVQDFCHELNTAGFGKPIWFSHRVDVCRAVLRFCSLESGDGYVDSLFVENFRRDLAESLFLTGRVQDSEALYDEWLATDPEWGWGWIGRSDNWLPDHELGGGDLARAEIWLRQGLDVQNVRDRLHLLNRLAECLKLQGCDDEADTVSAEAKLMDESAPPSRQLKSNLSQSVHSDEDPLALEYFRNWDLLTGLDDREMPTFGEHRPEVRLESVGPKHVGRNDPCPCGSGRKYKKCCGAN